MLANMSRGILHIAYISDEEYMTKEELLKAFNGGILRGSQAKLANLLEISTPTVSEWVSGKKKPSEENIKKMAKIFRKTEQELKTIWWNDEDEFAAAVRAVPLTQKNTISLPILADVPAGLPDFSEADVETFFDIPRWVFPGADFVVRCIGDSLEPEIRKGDFCVIRKTTEPLDGKQMLVKTEKGICMKVVRKGKGGKIWLCSINPAYQPFVPQELTVIGSILGHWSRTDKNTFKIKLPE